MKRYVYDIECNGFLEEADTIHCIAIGDVDTGEVESFGPNHITQGLLKLKEADVRIGHNIIRFDDQVIAKIKPAFSLDPKAAYDTLIASRLFFGNLSELDVIQRQPKNLKNGSHSLEAWGIRLGLHKIDFNAGFDKWTAEMQTYCEHDVRVNMKLYKHLMAQKDPYYAPQMEQMEMDYATFVAAMEREGMPFDVRKAAELYTKLSAERATIKHGLDALFPPWTEVDSVLIPKRDNKTLGYTKGVPVTKYKTVDFNPASRQHIAKCLTQKYNWKPKEFTPNGQAKIDEVVLSQLNFPEAQTLARFFLLNKRIGMLAEGDNSWLKCEKNGRIHAYYNTLGTVTGRTSCRDPNLQQVPSVKSPYGVECRELFYAPAGWTMLGADMSGLELRCLAHYMAHWDKGEYAKQVVDGDVHSLNQEAAGLPTRDNAKTFIYAFLYGAGDAKIGSIVGGNSHTGKQLKEAFLSKLPALKSLREFVNGAALRGYVKALDGRHIPIRSNHAALNSLLQGAGAILCKQWTLITDAHLKKHGYTNKDYKFIATIHDEVQMLVRPEIAEHVGELCRSSAVETGHYYDFQCPLAAEYRTGSTWAETH